MFEVAGMGWKTYWWRRSAHRKPAGRRPPLIVGPAALDVVERRVLVGGFVVHLPVREAAILEVLMRDAGRVVSLSELHSAIGARQADDDDVARWVRRLSRRLAVSPLLAPLIESVGTTGYRYIWADLPRRTA
jgi:two-component system, OmpR family, sensor histidine kinase KdpD